LINGEAFVVRERSPWKASPDLNKITNPKDFEVFMEMVAIATATSHVRGTQGKSPGQFKEVIASVLGDKSKRKKWGKSVARVAEMYREQVLLDYQCFKDYAAAKYPELPPKVDEEEEEDESFYDDEEKEEEEAATTEAPVPEPEPAPVPESEPVPEPSPAPGAEPVPPPPFKTPEPEPAPAPEPVPPPPVKEPEPEPVPPPAPVKEPVRLY
jgi:hypothetical protein